MGWPSRDEVHAFADEADRQVIDALLNADVERPGDPLLDRAEAVFTILEHEVMHQETLLYMWHRLPFDRKRRPAGYRPRVEGESPRSERIEIPAGCATLGVARGTTAFGWDNEHPASSANVAGVCDRPPRRDQRALPRVRGRRRLPRSAVVAARRLGRGCSARRSRIRSSGSADGDRWHWRGMFDLLPLPPAWPVYVSQAEASAFARWRGARLPTEAEFQRAAYGSPAGERVHPWGDAEPDATRGVFDFSSWDPEAAGSHPDGRERVGRRGSGRQRLGMDEHAVRAVSRLSGDGVVSGVLGRLLRRRALRHERGVDGDGDRSCCGRPSATGSAPAIRTYMQHSAARHRPTIRRPIDSLAGDVQYYLTLAPRQLPSRYFYDPLGSALFEAICELPWYRITKAERALLERHAREIFGARRSAVHAGRARSRQRRQAGGADQRRRRRARG